MIPLIFPSYPTKELTKVEFERLIDLFLVKDEAVWLRPFIQTPFLESSNCKCAYCERLPKDGGGDVQIDHYLPKTKENPKTKQSKLYPELAVWWYNLIPICKNCNVRKGTYDSGKNISLINPFLDDLKNNFQMKLHGDLVGKTPEGELTETKLHLNDIEDPKNGLSAKRNNRIKEVRASLASIKKDVDAVVKKGTKPNTDTRKGIYNPLLELMEQINPINSEIRFVAAYATALLHPDSDYWKIRTTINTWKYKPAELKTLNDLEATIQQYSLA